MLAIGAGISVFGAWMFVYLLAVSGYREGVRRHQVGAWIVGAYAVFVTFELIDAVGGKL